jgi:hypothetical protein
MHLSLEENSKISHVAFHFDYLLTQPLILLIFFASLRALKNKKYLHTGFFENTASKLFMAAQTFSVPSYTFYHSSVNFCKFFSALKRYFNPFSGYFDPSMRKNIFLEICAK